MGDMAMPALVEVEDDAAVAALGKVFLDCGIHRLERGAQKFDLEMQFVAVLFDLRHQRGDVGFQRFDSMPSEKQLAVAVDAAAAVVADRRDGLKVAGCTQRVRAGGRRDCSEGRGLVGP